MTPKAGLGRTPHPHYEILERCGSGGMGVVYKARDLRLKRVVALKFLQGESGELEIAVKRFRREAESIASLNHPNIATVYEFGEWDGEPFLATEFLSGGTLAARHRTGQAGHAELLSYASQLGEALEFAHRHGILHRDVKPANAMFSELGILKLVDFGLAKSMNAEELTRTGSSVGTLAYMAPELLRGEEATVQSDIYALGATLFEVACGRHMFEGGNFAELLQEIVNDRPAALTSLRADLPRQFASAIERSVARSRDGRYRSVADFLKALQLPNESATETITATASLIAPKNRNFLLLAIVVAVILIAAVAGTYYFRTSGSPSGKILAVLPFENLAGDAENQSLCDGLEETVTSLATSAGASRDLLVVPATEIRRGQVRTIAQARTQFRADLVITGAVQKTADRLRLTLNLADTRAVRQLDSRLISVAKSDAASLQDKLAEETGRLLGSGRPRSPSTKSPGDTTANSLAYSLYLEGAGEVDKRNANAAIEPLKKALQADPEFSLARAKLAEAYLWQNNFTSDPKWLALADEEVSRAAKSGENRETLMAQAMIRKATGDYPAAIALFRRLLSAEPANIEAYQLLAQTLQAANRITEAGEVLQQAVHLRPGYWPIRNTLGLFYMSQKNYRTAEQEFLSAAALAPGVPVIQSNLGALYFMMSRWPEAAASFERSLAIAPTAIGHSNLGTIYFYLGRYEDAAKEAKAATVLQPANSINWGNLGDAEWQIDGHRPQALEAFGQAVHLAEQQLQLNASNTKIRRNYALSLAKLGRPREAVSQIEMASSQAPSDPDVQFYAARVYAVTGATDRALAALSACRTLGCPQQEIEREPDLAALAKRSSK